MLVLGLGLGFAMRAHGACGVRLLQHERGEHAALRERAWLGRARVRVRAKVRVRVRVG